MCVCLYVIFGHLLGKGWPLGSRLWCLNVSLSLFHWYPGSGVVLDCIDSWSLHPYFLCWVVFFIFYSNFKRNICKQTVKNLIRRSVLRRLIWFCAVGRCPTQRTLGLYGFLTELRKRGKRRGLLIIYLNFALSLINSIIQEQNVSFFLSHYIKITWNSRFGRENVKMLPSFTQYYNGRHYVMLLNL